MAMTLVECMRDLADKGKTIICKKIKNKIKYLSVIHPILEFVF